MSVRGKLYGGRVVSAVRARLKLPVDVSTSGVSGVFEVRVVIGYNGVAVCLVAVEIRRARSRHLRH